jgi:hypothetical protein
MNMDEFSGSFKSLGSPLLSRANSTGSNEGFDLSQEDLGSPLMTGSLRSPKGSNLTSKRNPKSPKSPKSPRSPKSNSKQTKFKTPALSLSNTGGSSTGSGAKSQTSSGKKKLSSAQKIERLREQKKSSEKKVAKAKQRAGEEHQLFPGTISPPGSPSMATIISSLGDVLPLSSSPLRAGNKNKVGTRMQKRIEIAKNNALEDELAAMKARLAEDDDDDDNDDDVGVDDDGGNDDDNEDTNAIGIDGIDLPPPPPSFAHDYGIAISTAITAGLATGANGGGSSTDARGMNVSFEDALLSAPGPISEEHFSYLQEQYAYVPGKRERKSEEQKEEQNSLSPMPKTPAPLSADAFSPLFGASRTKSDPKASAPDDSYCYSPAASSTNPSPNKQESADFALIGVTDHVNIILFDDEVEVSREELDYIEDVEELLHRSHGDISRLEAEEEEEEEEEEDVAVDGEEFLWDGMLDLSISKEEKKTRASAGSSKSKKTTSKSSSGDKATTAGKEKKKKKKNTTHKGKTEIKKGSDAAITGPSTSLSASASSTDFGSALGSAASSTGELLVLPQSPTVVVAPRTPPSVPSLGGGTNRFGYSPGISPAAAGIIMPPAAPAPRLPYDYRPSPSAAETSLARGLMNPCLLPFLQNNEAALYFLFLAYASGPAAAQPPVHSSAAKCRPSIAQRRVCCFSTDNAWQLLSDWGVAPGWVSRGALSRLVDSVTPLCGLSATDSGSYTTRYGSNEAQQTQQQTPGSGRKSRIPLSSSGSKHSSPPRSQGSTPSSKRKGISVSSNPGSASKTISSSCFISFDEWLLLLSWLAREGVERNIIVLSKTTVGDDKGGEGGEEDEQLRGIRALVHRMSVSEGRATLHRKKGFHMRLAFNMK